MSDDEIEIVKEVVKKTRPQTRVQETVVEKPSPPIQTGLVISNAKSISQAEFLQLQQKGVLRQFSPGLNTSNGKTNGYGQGNQNSVRSLPNMMIKKPTTGGTVKTIRTQPLDLQALSSGNFSNSVRNQPLQTSPQLAVIRTQMPSGLADITGRTNVSFSTQRPSSGPVATRIIRPPLQRTVTQPVVRTNGVSPSYADHSAYQRPQSVQVSYRPVPISRQAPVVRHLAGSSLNDLRVNAPKPARVVQSLADHVQNKDDIVQRKVESIKVAAAQKTFQQAPLASASVTSTRPLTLHDLGLGGKSTSSFQGRPVHHGNEPAFYQKRTVHPSECYVRSNNWSMGDDNNEEFRGRFKCTWEDCDAILPSNISFCNHVVAHYLTTPYRTAKGDDENEGIDVSLEDFCRCFHCFKMFPTLYLLQEHVIQFHLHEQSANGCFICKTQLSSTANFHLHMAEKHGGPDAPYFCKGCKFRSSLAEDLWYHFTQEHNQTRLLMCPLCLFVCDALVNKYRGNKQRTLATSKDFINHLMQHVERQGEGMKCEKCLLVFAREADLVRHRKTSHKRMDGSRNDLEKIRYENDCPSSLIAGKSPLANRTLLRPAFKPLTLDEAYCIECRQLMNVKGHFRSTSTSCVVCNFETACNRSYENHMVDHARGEETTPSVFRKREVLNSKSWHCLCGYSSVLGNELASHLDSCVESDDTAYFSDSVPTEQDSMIVETDIPEKTVPIEQPLSVSISAMPPNKILKHLRLHPKSGRLTDDIDSDREDENLIRTKMREILERQEREKNKRNGSLRKPPPQLLRSMSSPKHLRPRQPSYEPPPAKRARTDSGSGSERTETPDDERQHLTRRGENETHHTFFGRKSRIFLNRKAVADEVGNLYHEQRAQLPKVENALSVSDDNLCDIWLWQSEFNVTGDSLSCILTQVDVEKVVDQLIVDVVENLTSESATVEAIAVVIEQSSSPAKLDDETADNDDTVDFDEFLAEIGADQGEEDGQKTEQKEAEKLFSRMEAVLAS